MEYSQKISKITIPQIVGCAFINVGATIYPTIPMFLHFLIGKFERT
jgi:hypothetical protein